MTLTNLSTSMMTAQALPEQSDAQKGAPEWIHLLPAGEIPTDDARGPYHVSDPASMIAASFHQSTKIPVDINHSTHKLGAQGHEAPAVGWIVEMQTREDGVWGRVEWTPRGEAIVAGREYRGVSPVFQHTAAKDVKAVIAASLTNNPNLRNMVALHTKEPEMNFLDKLKEMLGVDATASEADVMKALKAKLDGDADAPAMQTAMSEIGVAFGLAKDADPKDIVTAAQTAQVAAKDATAKDGMIVALQTSVKQMGEEIKSLTSGQAMQASEAFYETALAEKRAGVGPASKEHLISMHQSNPDAAVAFVASMPKLGATATTLQPPEAKDGQIALNQSQRDVAAQMGMSEADYAKELKENEEAA